jgi:hypothetical protein
MKNPFKFEYERHYGGFETFQKYLFGNSVEVYHQRSTGKSKRQPSMLRLRLGKRKWSATFVLFRQRLNYLSKIQTDFSRWNTPEYHLANHRMTELSVDIFGFSFLLGHLGDKPTKSRGTEIQHVNHRKGAEKVLSWWACGRLVFAKLSSRPIQPMSEEEAAHWEQFEHYNEQF